MPRHTLALLAALPLLAFAPAPSTGVGVGVALPQNVAPASADLRTEAPADGPLAEELGWPPEAWKIRRRSRRARRKAYSVTRRSAGRTMSARRARQAKRRRADRQGAHGVGKQKAKARRARRLRFSRRRV